MVYTPNPPREPENYVNYVDPDLPIPTLDEMWYRYIVPFHMSQSLKQVRPEKWEEDRRLCEAIAREVHDKVENSGLSLTREVRIAANTELLFRVSPSNLQVTATQYHVQRSILQAQIAEQPSIPVSLPAPDDLMDWEPSKSVLALTFPDGSPSSGGNGDAGDFGGSSGPETASVDCSGSGVGGSDGSGSGVAPSGRKIASCGCSRRRLGGAISSGSSGSGSSGVNSTNPGSTSAGSGGMMGGLPHFGGASGSRTSTGSLPGTNGISTNLGGLPTFGGSPGSGVFFGAGGMCVPASGSGDNGPGLHPPPPPPASGSSFPHPSGPVPTGLPTIWPGTTTPGTGNSGILGATGGVGPAATGGNSGFAGGSGGPVSSTAGSTGGEAGNPSGGNNSRKRKIPAPPPLRSIMPPPPPRLAQPQRPLPPFLPPSTSVQQPLSTAFPPPAPAAPSSSQAGGNGQAGSNQSGGNGQGSGDHGDDDSDVEFTLER